jgi:hypothetical protein
VNGAAAGMSQAALMSTTTSDPDFTGTEICRAAAETRQVPS